MSVNADAGAVKHNVLSDGSSKPACVLNHFHHVAPVFSSVTATGKETGKIHPKLPF
jgi:hypothetical protein